MITWPAVPGKRYRVQFKDDLEMPGWFDLNGDVTASADTAAKTDSTIAAATTRLYRVLVLPWLSGI